jgi:hypothetical protein
MASIAQNAAAAPPMSAWDKPMNEVRIAPTYKLASFSDDTASLQSTIAQLKIDNARYAAKQLELQEQLSTLQISVTSLTSASTLNPDPSAAITQSILTKVHSIFEQSSADLPAFAELTALIKSLSPIAGNKV